MWKRILSTEAFEVVATLLSIPQRPDAAFEIAFCFFFSCSYKAILKENFISSKINFCSCFDKLLKTIVPMFPYYNMLDIKIKNIKLNTTVHVNSKYFMPLQQMWTK